MPLITVTSPVDTQENGLLSSNFVRADNPDNVRVTFVGVSSVSRTGNSNTVSIGSYGLTGGYDTKAIDGDLMIFVNALAIANTYNTANLATVYAPQDGAYTWRSAQSLNPLNFGGTGNACIKTNIHYVIKVGNALENFTSNTIGDNRLSGGAQIYVFRGLNTFAPLDNVGFSTSATRGNNNPVAGSALVSSGVATASNHGDAIFLLTGQALPPGLEAQFFLANTYLPAGTGSTMNYNKADPNGSFSNVTTSKLFTGGELSLQLYGSFFRSIDYGSSRSTFIAGRSGVEFSPDYGTNNKINNANTNVASFETATMLRPIYFQRIETYTGSSTSDRATHLTLPPWTSRIKLKAWGAGGASGHGGQNTVNTSTRPGNGGPGGYAQTNLSLTLSSGTLTSLNIRAASCTNSNFGNTATERSGGPGGSWSGVFSGTNDQIVLIIAGGGGGGGGIPYIAASNSSNGFDGAPGSGGVPILAPNGFYGNIATTTLAGSANTKGNIANQLIATSGGTYLQTAGNTATVLGNTFVTDGNSSEGSFTANIQGISRVFSGRVGVRYGNFGGPGGGGGGYKSPGGAGMPVTGRGPGGQGGTGNVHPEGTDTLQLASNFGTLEPPYVSFNDGYSSSSVGYGAEGAKSNTDTDYRGGPGKIAVEMYPY